jgi:hypothetical protein
MFAAATGTAAAAAVISCICVRYARTALHWFSGVGPGELAALSLVQRSQTAGGDSNKLTPPERAPPLQLEPSLPPAAATTSWRALPTPGHGKLGGNSSSGAKLDGGSVVGWQLSEGPRAAEPRRCPSPNPAPTRPILRSPSLTGEGGWAEVAAAAAAATGRLAVPSRRRVSLLGEQGCETGRVGPWSGGHNPPPPSQNRCHSPSGLQLEAVRRFSVVSRGRSGSWGALQQPPVLEAGIGSTGTSLREARGGGGSGSFPPVEKQWSVV